MKSPILIVTILLSSLLLVNCKKKDGNQLTTQSSYHYTDCNSVIKDPDLLYFFPFRNGSMMDIASNGKSLIPFNGPFLCSDRFGNSNCAFEFKNYNPDMNQHFESSDTLKLQGVQELSISLWYMALDTSNKGKNPECLVARGLNIADWYNFKNFKGDRNVCWWLGLYDCRSSIVGNNNFSEIWGNSNTNSSCNQIVIDKTNKWIHLVGTFSYGKGEVKLYANSILLSQEKVSVPITNPSQEIGKLFLGLDFTGRLDDVIVFKKVLNPQEVIYLYQLPSCCN